MMKTLAETSVGDYFLSYDDKHAGKVFVVESISRWGVSARPILFVVDSPPTTRLQPSASSHAPITFEVDTEVSVVKMEIKLVTDF